jgi:hypothetical protein
MRILHYYGSVKMSKDKDRNHYSLCFLRFFDFMEHHPTAFGLTSKKHRGWMYVEFLKSGQDMFLVHFALHKQKPQTLSPLNARYVPSGAHFATLPASA